MDFFIVFFKKRNLPLFDFFKKAFNGASNIIWKQKNSNKIPLKRKNGTQYYCNMTSLNEEAVKPKKNGTQYYCNMIRLNEEAVKPKRGRPPKQKTAEEIEAEKVR